MIPLTRATGLICCMCAFIARRVKLFSSSLSSLQSICIPHTFFPTHPFHSVVALAQGHGIDVHVNEMSRRETPSAVLFRGRRRLFGDLALAGAGAAPQSVVTQLRRLLGAALKITDDDEMEREEGEGEGEEEEEDEEEDKCVFEPFGAGLMGKGGEDDPCHVGPRIKVRHVGRDIELSAAQVVAMLMSHLRKEVEAAHGESNVLNTVISVPAWFGRAQRALVMDAARVARCPSPACVTDGTALALGYGLLNMVRSVKRGRKGEGKGCPLKFCRQDSQRNVTCHVSSLRNFQRLIFPR